MNTRATRSAHLARNHTVDRSRPPPSSARCSSISNAPSCCRWNRDLTTSLSDIAFFLNTYLKTVDVFSNRRTVNSANHRSGL